MVSFPIFFDNLFKSDLKSDYETSFYFFIDTILFLFKSSSFINLVSFLLMHVFCFDVTTLKNLKIQQFNL